MSVCRGITKSDVRGELTVEMTRKVIECVEKRAEKDAERIKLTSAGDVWKQAEKQGN